jgi:hypothetical protein
MVRSAARPRVSNHLAVDGLAVILRDAAKRPLLRMRAEIYSQPLRMRFSRPRGEERGDAARLEP